MYSILMISNLKPSPVEQLRQMLRHFRRVVPVGEDVEQVRGGGKIEPFEKKSKDEGDEDRSDKRQNNQQSPLGRQASLSRDIPPAPSHTWTSSLMVSLNSGVHSVSLNRPLDNQPYWLISQFLGGPNFSILKTAWLISQFIG